MSNLSRRRMLMASAALSLVLTGAVSGRAIAAEPPALQRLASQRMMFDWAFVASLTFTPLTRRAAASGAY